MKKILYLLPFALCTAFYLFIILVERGVNNIAILDVGLLLALLLICGLGTLSKKKVFNVIGIISLFIVSFVLIKTGIENTYFILAETKIAIAILIYYLIVFIISKNKALIIMNGVAIGILLILFVPTKTQCNDGGTIEYRTIAYRYIKWNLLREDTTYYKSNDLYWFPKNFHSIEYYKPVESPIVNVSSNNQQIICSKGSFQWSKTVDGQQIHLIADVFKSPTEWTYNDSLTITNDNTVTVDTSYNIRDVKYTEYKEEYANSEIGTKNYEFIKLDFNNENKTIDLKDFENGTYIITFTIYNNKDYADYAFKVEVKDNISWNPLTVDKKKYATLLIVTLKI